LAASILAHGVLENLIVSPAGDARGKQAVFEVAAGGRRYAALKLLVKRRKIDPDYEVPCQVRAGSNGCSLVEISLAENLVRAPLHPADQYDAFAALRAEGLSVDDIGARFGLTSGFVAQRLKLAAVSPRLMKEYREGKMTLDQLMAFTLSDDHAVQEEVWFGLPYREVSSDTIRRHLTQSQVHGEDRRARFIGAEAYEQSGGVIVRDLFTTEGAGYFADSQLLDRLVAEKLETEAAPIRDEGWKWVEVWSGPDFEALARFGQARKVEKTLSARDERRLARLSERYDALVADLEDDEPAPAELDRVSEELQALQARKVTWADGEVSRSGSVAWLESDGTIRVFRGLVRREDRDANDANGSGQGKRKAKANGAFSDSLLADLSAHRTAALRELIAAHPDHAVAALLYELVARIFFDEYRQGCVGLAPTVAEPARFSKSVEKSKASASFQARHAKWQQQLPAPEDLWEWLMGLAGSDRLALLAHCVALTIDGIWRRDASDGRHLQVDRLVHAVSLDMADWWRPDGTNFFGGVTKEQIVKAVSEGCSPAAARRLESLKKGDMSVQAEQLLGPTRWLPGPLRLQESVIGSNQVVSG
jgi:ParB family chromosome partitioning protein